MHEIIHDSSMNNSHYFKIKCPKCTFSSAYHCKIQLIFGSSCFINRLDPCVTQYKIFLVYFYMYKMLVQIMFNTYFFSLRVSKPTGMQAKKFLLGLGTINLSLPVTIWAL